MAKKSQIVKLPDAGETLQAMLHFYLACCRSEKVSIKTSAGEIMSPALAKERIKEARIDEGKRIEARVKDILSTGYPDGLNIEMTGHGCLDIVGFTIKDRLKQLQQKGGRSDKESKKAHTSRND